MNIEIQCFSSPKPPLITILLPISYFLTMSKIMSAIRALENVWGSGYAKLLTVSHRHKWSLEPDIIRIDKEETEYKFPVYSGLSFHRFHCISWYLQFNCPDCVLYNWSLQALHQVSLICFLVYKNLQNSIII